jgi:DeoR family suf operon transcriptional repressor
MEPASMQPPAPVALPLGYKGPRGTLLVELKKEPGRTARELARAVGLSLNAVRHHLKELEAEGVVAYQRVHRGVGAGAPGFAYRLTAAGEQLFPRRYEETLLQLLDYVVAREGRSAAVGVLEHHFEALAARLAPELEGLSPAERMRRVVGALSEHGYMAEGSATFCCGTLVEHNCAIRAVAERFPEVCAAEARFLGRVLEGTVERRGHMLQGGCACAYKIRFSKNDSESIEAGVGTGAHPPQGTRPGGNPEETQ